MVHSYRRLLQQMLGGILLQDPGLQAASRVAAEWVAGVEKVFQVVRVVGAVRMEMITVSVTVERAAIAAGVVVKEARMVKAWWSPGRSSHSILPGPPGWGGVGCG
jgi:hypothetical protein